MQKYIIVLIAFLGIFPLWVASAANNEAKTPLSLPNEHEEVQQSVSVEPILLIGNVEVFDIDFTPALEAISIASYQKTPYYPVLAGSFGGDLASWWQEGDIEKIIRQYNWSKILIQQADSIARSDIIAFEDSLFPYAQLGRELQSQVFLIEGGDFTSHDIESFASRQDTLLKNYQELSRLSSIKMIPVAHLMARLQTRSQIKVIDDKGNITIEGAWAAAAITYMGLSGERPANPDFSRLYPNLQELIKPFAAIDVNRRFDIIDTAWDEWQNYLRLAM
ncbi:MAG: hypothetical protein ACK5MJ_07225 [Alphaproteobacteria bacterium]